EVAEPVAGQVARATDAELRAARALQRAGGHTELRRALPVVVHGHRALVRVALCAPPSLAAVVERDRDEAAGLAGGGRRCGSGERGGALRGLLCRGDRHNGESRSRCEQRYEDTQSHVSLSPTSEDWSIPCPTPAVIVPEA